MSRNASVLAVGVLAAGVLLLPAAPASAGQFHGVDVVDDFDCDGVSDRVDLADHYDIGDAVAAGAIIVYPSSGDEQTISQNTPGVPGTAESGDSFGEVYASTDFNGDGCDELVVSSPGEDEHAGMVTVINGSPNGLVPSESVAYTQNSPGVPGTSESWDKFGEVLAAGATASGQAYLLVGSPGEKIGSQYDAGSVHYLRGGVWRSFHQDSPGVAGAGEHGDGFGGSIAASDRYFVVGTPGEDISGATQAGQIHVFSHRIVGGIPDPLTAISQDSTGVSGTAEYADYFGETVSIVSYLPSATAPIGALVAVGSPMEAIGSAQRAGMVHVLAVTPDGTFSEVAGISQNTSGVADSAREWDYFGTDVVFGVEDGGLTATPSTAVMAVSVVGEDRELGGAYGAIHLFTDLTSPPGEGDRLFKHDPYGPLQQTRATRLGSTSSALLLGEWGTYGNAIPWSALIL